VRLGTHHTSRILFALALGIVSLLSLCSSALGAWSTATQVKGFSGASRVVASVDDGGIQQLGLLATGGPSGQGLYNLTRAPGASDWTPLLVFGPAANNGRFAFARNGAAMVTWQGSGQSVWAAYKPAGKAWGAPSELDNPPKLGIGPLPAISAAGQAAVVWSRKTALEKREPDQIVYSSTTTASWPSTPSLLASIEPPQPADPDHFNTCLPGSGLVAGILPNGIPIAAWNDAYGSFKEEITDLVPPIQSGHNELGLCGVKIATPGNTVPVTPRPAVGWSAAGTGALPFWYPVGIEVDPDTGRTALVIRGNDDAVTESDAVCDFPGTQESDYCFDHDAFETRVSLGSGTGVTHPGTLTGDSVVLALRKGVLAIAARGPSPLAAGVGLSFPSLTTLATDAPLISSAIAVGPKGEAQLVVHTSGNLKTFGVPAGGAFAAANDIATSEAGVDLAIGCNGDALAAWNRGANGLFVATNPSGAAQCEGSGPGGEEPSTPGGGGGTSTETPAATTASGAGSAAVVAPAPSAKKPAALKCKKGFQKKTVRGKAKCVKKAKKGKKRR